MRSCSQLDRYASPTGASSCSAICIADEFVYGRVARVSREAPVLILEYDSTEILPGGAAMPRTTRPRSARASVWSASPAATRRAAACSAALPRRVDSRAIVRPGDYQTPVKTRILAGGIHSAKQQVVRIDRRNDGITDEQRAAVERAARRGGAARRCGAGVRLRHGARCRRRLWRSWRARLRSARRRVPVLIDSRYALTRYSRLTACTPNESEVEQVLGVTIDDNPRVLERAGRTLLERTKMEAVLITRGSRGMALFEPDKPTVHIPIYGSDQIADVTGAGDTVMATMTLALGSGATFEEAARLANYAGGLVVMKRGTATVTRG